MNVLKAVDDNALDEIDTLRTAAADALAKFVALKQEVAHLEAMAELRKASGAQLQPIKLTLTA